MIFAIKICIIIVITLVQIVSRNASFTSSRTYIDFKLKIIERDLAKIDSQHVDDQKPAEDDDDIVSIPLEKSFRAVDHTSISSDEMFKLLESVIKSMQLKTVPKNSLESAPLELSNLMISEKYESSIEFNDRENRSILHIKEETEKLAKYVAGFLSPSKTTFTSDNILLRANKISVGGKVYVENLYVNNLKVEYLNEEEFEREKIIISGINQTFTHSLRAKHIYIDNLDIPSLCGLKYEDWLRTGETVKTGLININSKNTIIQNNTIFIDDRHDFFIDDLRAKEVNNFSKSLLDDLFIIGKNQVIKDTISIRFKNVIEVLDFHAKEINNITAENFITKHTNQSLDKIYIGKLEANKIFVEKVNGVPVNEAARKTQTNIIKGRISIKNLVISDELVIKDSIALPLSYPTQVYEDVTIDGNIFITNVMIQGSNRGSGHLVIADDNGLPAKYSVQGLLDNSWSRSRNQIITAPTILEKGASIDHLSCFSVNGLQLSDAVLVNSTEITASSPLIFDDFQFNGFAMRYNDSEAEFRFFDESIVNVMTVNKPIRWKNLSVINVQTDAYNGIPVEMIMQGNHNVIKFFPFAEFETVRVANLTTVDYLQMDRLNYNADILPEKALTADENFQLDELSLHSLNVRNLVIGNLLGKNLEEALQAQDMIASTWALNPLKFSSLTVNGNVVVRELLQINKINEEDIDTIVNRIKSFSLENLIDFRGIKKHLHILRNLNISYLNGRNFNDLFDEALTISGKQMHLREAEFMNVNVDYLKTKTVNEINLTARGFIDEPVVFYGNVSFSELTVRGRTTSKTIRNQPSSKLDNRVREISLKNLTSLTVIGYVSWNNSLSSAHSLGYLLKNAVTKHENQLLHYPVSFVKPVIIHNLHLERSESSLVYQEINRIVSDAVVDQLNLTSIVYSSKKFTNSLHVDRLNVTNDLCIENINGFKVNDVIRKIFQAGNNNVYEPVDGQKVVFFKDVEIRSLVANSKIHGVAFNELCSYRETIPNKVYFENLIVQGNVTLDNLDGIPFDSFKNNRVTIHGDSQVYADVEFTDTISVLKNKSFVSLINEIAIKDIIGVDDDNIYIQKPISERKAFYSSELIVLGDIETNILNGFLVSSQGDTTNHQSRNFSVEDSMERDIFSDLVFRAGVEVFGHVNVSDEINGKKTNHIFQVESYDQARSSAVQALMKVKSSFMDTLTLWNLTIGTRSQQEFHYLEQNDYLLPSQLHLAGIQSVKSTKIGDATRLDVYVTPTAAFCELSSNSSNNCISTCLGRYTFEMSPEHKILLLRDSLSLTSKVLSWSSSDERLFFEIEIISEQCSDGQNYEPTKSKVILWRGDGSNKYQLLEFDGLVIADAQIFNTDDRLYLMLAVFYNEKIKSYSTTSILCEIHLQDNSANVVQNIKTDGAKSIEIFEIKSVGLHAVIGCVKGKAESQLLRFDKRNCRFQLVRTFVTGGSKFVASIVNKDDIFVILNNPDIEVLQIYAYDSQFDSFYDYQNLLFESKITGLSVINRDLSYGDAFIVTTTKDGWLYIYEYVLYGKFQLKVSHWIEDIQILAPFSHNNQNYLFTGTKLNNTIFVIIQQDFI